MRAHGAEIIRPKMKKREKISFGDEWRMRGLFLCVLLVGVSLIGRLYYVQIVDHKKWKSIAEDQHNVFQELSAERGEIFMRDGDGWYPLAVNREYKMAYVVPKDVTEKERVAAELSAIVGIDIEEIRGKVNRPDDPFEIIKKRLTEDEEERIRSAHLTGVAFLPEKYRYYPAGELGAQVVGFASLGEDGGAGGYGIESSQDNRLRGETGMVSQEKDAGGRWIALSDREIVAPRHGADVVLTLDRVIQYETEKILREAMEKHKADRATAIVVDPKTGALLAMASLPQFDPNEYSKVEDYSVFLNPAVSLSYEPGSIMKPITLAIGIEEKKISPHTEYVDTGVVKISGYDIRNSENKVYGRSTMMKVLEESINTGVIFVEKLVGNQTFRDYFERFGFGKKTSVALPAELAGDTRNLSNLRSDIQFFTASFGQGVTVTPLQMVMAYAALANGGILYKPAIIDSLIYPDGTKEKMVPEEVRRVVSKETSESIGEMLESVVVRGHGKRAQVSGYRVGGKTGTAQVAKSNSLGYEEGLTIGSFVGYAPIDDPRFVVLVKIDNPKDVQWAESSAAPTFGRIMKFLLEYAKIKPTESVVSKE
ncbi:MAG: penicillin-binding protein 2 [Candidatus Moranbacteria bacterium]|nr:penicillin-binding protein 2 [Candidatus Moranbacteria bacterium]